MQRQELLKIYKGKHAKDGTFIPEEIIGVIGNGKILMLKDGYAITRNQLLSEEMEAVHRQLGVLKPVRKCEKCGAATFEMLAIPDLGSEEVWARPAKCNCQFKEMGL